MGNKYIDISATYNGDGTSKDQATTAGGVGAWNSFLNCLKSTQTYGVISPGDVIYVRTKNGSDLTQLVSANCDMVSTATATSPVSWVFDDGSIWGEEGIFTFSIAGFCLSFADFNNFYGGYGETRRFVVLNTFSSNSSQLLGAKFGHNHIQSVLFDVSSTSASSIRMVYYTQRAGDLETKLIDAYFNVYSMNSLTYYPLLSAYSNSSLLLINPTFNLNYNLKIGAIFGPQTYGCEITVIGGRVLGAYNGSHCLLSTTNKGIRPTNINILNFDLGDATLYLNSSFLSYDYSKRIIELVNFTSRVNSFDFFSLTNRGSYEWWDYQNYPTLNATLPNGRSWSVRVTPFGTTLSDSLLAASTSKLYTLDPAIKTITTELLIEDKYTNPTKKSFYVNINYIDDLTGQTIYITSFTFLEETLEASTAEWSTLLYGDPTKTFKRYKIVLVTPSSIKKLSQIYMSFEVKDKSMQPTDYLFIDPDFSVS